MMNKILGWLNGALGVKEFQPMAPEDEIFPEEGIVSAPEFFEMPANPQGGLYLVPECTLLVSVGAQVVGGQPVAEIDTPSHIFEVVSPCSGTVVEQLIQSGQVVEAGQPLLKLQRP
jgi:biotin carboxyl carrier protein